MVSLSPSALGADYDTTAGRQADTPIGNLVGEKFHAQCSRNREDRFLLGFKARMIEEYAQLHMSGQERVKRIWLSHVESRAHGASGVDNSVKE